MAITSLDGIVTGLATARQKFYIAKSGFGGATTGQNSSYWRAGGNPTVAAIPSAAESCNNNTLGAVPFNNPVAGQSTYLARLSASSTIVQGYEIHDRLAHMGGLSGIVTSLQNVSLDLSVLGDNIALRKGRADYTNVQWWLEWHTATGSTATTLSVFYTDVNGNSKSVNVSAPAGMAFGRLLAITPPDGIGIKAVNAVGLSVSTGTAGNIGVTATLQRTEFVVSSTNIPIVADWAYLGLTPIFDNACLMFMGNNATGSAGSLNGALTLIQG
jgi:hypothetical protein